MNTLSKIIKYQIHDIFRSKWLLIYTFFFLAVSYGLTALSGDASHVAVSLMNVILLVIPLVSIVFGTIYIYNSREYILFMLSQPIPRRALYLGLFLGLCLPLSASFAVGVLVPVAVYAENFGENSGVWFSIIAAGMLETVTFTALAIAIAIWNENKILGLGLSIFSWLFFSAIYDGMLLLILNMFRDYPLEKLSVGLIMLNPVDLARIFIILKLDVSALMGYTGAVFQQFFGTAWGTVLSIATLILWGLIPLWFGLRKFERKDL